MIGDGIPRTPTPLFLNEERLKQYFNTFQELHQLHAKQNEDLKKLVDNLHERLTVIEKTNPILLEEFKKLEKVFVNYYEK